MKAKTFIPHVIKDNRTEKSRDYWGLLFVGMIFVISIGSFLIDSHRENQKKYDSERPIYKNITINY